MATPRLTKNWDIYPNIRLTPYVSLVATMGWFGYETLTRLKLSGWSVKWTCDGTTGPADASDVADRITSATSFQTRATVAAAPQSYFVVENADGVQLMITYQGASDDIARISYSADGLFALAGTTTQQPTATDEVVVATATTIISTSASQDRVMQVWCTDESWFFAMYCNSSTVITLGVEKFDSVIPIAIQSKPYMAWNYVDMTRASTNNTFVNPCGYFPSVAVGAASFRGAMTRHTYGGVARTSRMAAPIAGSAGAGQASVSSPTWITGMQPAMQNGSSAALLVAVWQGERVANLDGLAGPGIDWWIGLSNSTSAPQPRDVFYGLDPSDAPNATPRANWLIALGSAIVRPWRDAATAMEIA